LLEISHEQELDRFLSKIISSASRAAGGTISSQRGSVLGGVLKAVAGRTLRFAGGTLGNLVAPGVGGVIGKAVGSAAGRAFGLELEGLSGEDREFEVARQYVRFATAAAQEAAATPPEVPPPVAAQDAANAAAQQAAPGLLATPQAAPPPRAANGRGPLPRRGLPGKPGPVRTGRWVRRGHHILLLGVYRHPQMG
jgi:hypothetical protein